VRGTAAGRVDAESGLRWAARASQAVLSLARVRGATAPKAVLVTLPYVKCFAPMTPMRRATLGHVGDRHLRDVFRFRSL